MPTFGLGSSERIARSLRDQIISGHLPPGTRLKDAHLAATYGVSRNTVREAQRELVLQGLVISRPHAGSSVRMLTETDAREIYRVRRTLEGAGVEHSVKAGKADVAALSEHIDAAQDAASRDEWLDVGTSSVRIHQAIVGFIGSSMLDAFFATIMAQMRLVFSVNHDEASIQQPWMQRDEELVSLIRSGHRKQALLVLGDYLDDSEAQMIDAIRANRSA